MEIGRIFFVLFLLPWKSNEIYSNVVQTETTGHPVDVDQQFNSSMYLPTREGEVCLALLQTVGYIITDILSFTIVDVSIYNLKCMGTYLIYRY